MFLQCTPFFKEKYPISNFNLLFCLQRHRTLVHKYLAASFQVSEQFSRLPQAFLAYSPKYLKLFHLCASHKLKGKVSVPLFTFFMKIPSRIWPNASSLGNLLSIPFMFHVVSLIMKFSATFITTQRQIHALHISSVCKILMSRNSIRVNLHLYLLLSPFHTRLPQGNQKNLIRCFLGSSLLADVTRLIFFRYLKLPQ